MTNTLYFKVETTAKEENFFDLSVKEQKLFRIFTKSEEKENIEEFYKKNAPLYPEFSKVACIIVGIEKSNDVLKKGKIAEKSEKELLLKFNDYCLSLIEDSYFKAVSFSKFDYNTLITKARYYGIKLNGLIDQSERKPWEQSTFNVMDMYRQMSGNYISLALMAHCFDLEYEEKEYDFDINTLVAIGDEKLTLTYNLFKKLI